MKNASLSDILKLHRDKKLCGVFNLSNSDYHAAPGLSKSALDNINVSPAHYKWRLANPLKLSESLIFGSAYHCLALEPEKFDSEFYVTKTQPREPELDSKGRSPLSDGNLQKITNMIIVLKADLDCQRFLTGHKEIAFFATHPETGILVKTKLDLILPNGIIVDLKTAKDVTDEGLSKAMAERRYHVQGAFALDVVRWAQEQAQDDFGLKTPDTFVLCSQAKTDNFEIDREHILPESIVVGEAEYLANLNTYAECNRSGEWPGVKSKGMPGRNLPIWYMQRVMNKEG